MHITRERECRALNHMLGPKKYRQLYTGYTPPAEPASGRFVSQRRMQEWWGEEIHNFGARFMEALAKE